MQGCTKGVFLAGFLLLLLSCAGDVVVVEPMPTTPNLTSRWCTIGDTRIHYLDVDRSSSDCSLLIVHGYLGSTTAFLQLIETLAQDLRVVMPDLPPFGASERPNCSYSMAFYIDFLAQFSQTVGLDHCYLLGTSMGANIAAHYATEYPAQIQGLIFLSPFGLHDQAGRMTQIKRWDALLPLVSSLITKRGVQRRLHRSILKDERITPELVDAYWNPFTTPEGRRATVEITREIVGRCSMEEVLPRIERPVLILMGSEDKLLSADDREKFHLLLVDERQEIVEDSGHFLYLDSPDLVSLKIVAFTKGGKL
jgi:pimeloyl-ACP methyl ester carboxylesterase